MSEHPDETEDAEVSFGEVASETPSESVAAEADATPDDDVEAQEWVEGDVAGSISDDAPSEGPTLSTMTGGGPVNGETTTP